MTYSLRNHYINTIYIYIYLFICPYKIYLSVLSNVIPVVFLATNFCPVPDRCGLAPSLDWKMGTVTVPLGDLTSGGAVDELVVQLVQKTPISLWFMVPITSH